MNQPGTTTNLVNIRSFAEADIASVRELLIILAADLGEKVKITSDQLDTSARYMLDRSDSYAAFVAETASATPKVLGFVSSVFYSSLFTGRIALVNELVVNPEFRNRGVGGRLMSRVFDEARLRGATEIEVGRIKDNEGAARFYRRAGFTEEYVLHGHEFQSG